MQISLYTSWHPILSLTMALTSIAVIPIGPWVTVGGVHTPLQIADVNIGLLIILGSDFDRRLRSRAGGLVVQQQVFDAGQPARHRADGELRNRAGTVAGGSADLCRQLQPARHRDAQSGRFWAYSQVEHLHGTVHRFLHLHHGRLCRDQPYSVRPGRKQKPSWSPDITPNTVR